MKEDQTACNMNQGLVTILGSNCEKNISSSSSLRRTLSADHMSAKIWLKQNRVFSTVKKMASANDDDSSSSSSSSEGDDDHVQESIQSKNERNETPKQYKLDVWGAILTQKKDDVPPPYVHPLVKKSSSFLSKRSLDICTENLGSETGSYPNPEAFHDADEDIKRSKSLRNSGVATAKTKKSPAAARPLPPPLTSISGASMHMRSRRENGRLVLEAVSVPPRKYLQSKRQNGRLVLTMIIDNPTPQENRVEIVEEAFVAIEKVDEKLAQEKVEFVMEKISSRSLPNGVSGVQKSGLMIKNLVRLDNKSCDDKRVDMNLTWQKESNMAKVPIHHYLHASSFNAYEYFWRNKGTQQVTSPKRNYHKINKASNCVKSYDHQQMVFIKGNKGEYLEPYMRGCNKEPRRSLVIWEPYYIATS